MASLVNDPCGKRRIVFVNKDGDRKTIYLGKFSKALAKEIKMQVEAINANLIAGYPNDGATAEWLGKIGDTLHAKLAGVDLVPPRQPTEAPEQVRLVVFLDSYIAGRTDIKPRTLINLEACKTRLVEFFGRDRALDSITAGDAKDWDISLKARYAKGTIGRTIKRAKQFFQAAIDKELIGKNPFAKIKPPSQVNESRKHFVTLEDARKVLDACPDAEWKLLFALSRFGGLRCPSEHLALTWADVDWARNKFRVVSSKKEHLDGGGVRWVPIFPELRPYLEAVFFDPVTEGAVHVIRRYRDENQNLRTQLNRIIRRAGLEPWPKLFQNLRATRETELAKIHPLHHVCYWIGNTERIAQKHYLQVTDEDFTNAAQKHSAPYSALLAKTAQKTAQHGTRTEHAQNEKTPEKPGFSEETSEFCEENRYPQGDSNPCLSLERAMS